MDCILYHQLTPLVNVAINIFKGLQESDTQPARSLSRSNLTFSQHNDIVSNREWLSSSTFQDYLSQTEAQEILQQVETISRADCLPVFWTGIPRQRAQEWADARGMSTLATIMGPLMDNSNERCQRSSKGPKLWSKYIKGASIIFSLYAKGKGTVTVVTVPPPLQLTNLRPGCTFLSLEEPILKGELGGLHKIGRAHV